MSHHERMRRPTRISPISREVYTLRSLETAFPSGEWVEVEELEGAEAELPGHSLSTAPSPVRPPSITIIGGTKYDEYGLEVALDSYHPETLLITGDGRGAEAEALKFYETTLRDSVKLELEPDLYGKGARKVNVEAVLSYHLTSPLLLVGEGKRVKQAKSWLKRANWGREVTELP